MKKEQIAKYPNATSRNVKLGDIIIHEISGKEQTLNEFGLNFWKNCHPIERKGWHIKPKQQI